MGCVLVCTYVCFIYVHPYVCMHAGVHARTHVHRLCGVFLCCNDEHLRKNDPLPSLQFDEPVNSKLWGEMDEEEDMDEDEDSDDEGVHQCRPVHQ